jgi:riboflavin biosynthesis pyrimidine reductase
MNTADVAIRVKMQALRCTSHTTIDDYYIMKTRLPNQEESPNHVIFDEHVRWKFTGYRGFVDAALHSPSEVLSHCSPACSLGDRIFAVYLNLAR